MKSFFLGALCSLASLCSFGQDRFTISGYMKDASNGEALIGATAFIKEISNGTISNVYGFYSITLPKGTYSLVYRYVGFNDVTLASGVASLNSSIPAHHQSPARVIIPTLP